MDFLALSKAKAYAMALPNDISAERFEVVEDGRLWRGFAGTVYGRLVGTDHGHKFGSFTEARANAERFVEQCRRIAVAQKEEP